MKHAPELVVFALDGALPSHIDKMMRMGELPAFRKLMENGSRFSDCRPPFPTITPTCWASFSTGATPSAHGAVCQNIHLPGKPLDELVASYHSANIHAERFWEAAARGGKRSLIMQLPTSGPARSELVFQIGGAGCGAIDGMVPNLPTNSGNYEVPAQLFVSGEGEGGSMTWSAGTPASGQWKPPGESQGKVDVVIDRERSVVLQVDPSGSRSGIEPFSWHVNVGQDRVVIRSAEEDLQEGTTLHAGMWTDTLERTLSCRSGKVTYRYRAKLLHADGENRRLSLYFTEMGDVREHASPERFARELGDIPGVAPSFGHHYFIGSGLDHRTFLEAEAMNFDWQREAIERTWEKQDIDITVVYSVYLDTINHLYRNAIEGIEAVPEGDYDSVRRFYDDAYKLADRFIADIMDKCGPDTTVVIVSDHGAVGYDAVINPFAVLEEAGLIVYDAPVGTPGRSVDWSRTAAYPAGSCHIFVNLKGRDPDGIVEAGEYDGTVQRIIGALQAGYRDDERGIYPLAFALRREEAGLVGLGGPSCGDVVYGIAGGRIGGHIGGIHACQIPTARTGTGDVRSLLAMSGPAIEAGKIIGRPVHLYDVAPTLCHALNYPQPRDAEGAVIFQALKAGR